MVDILYILKGKLLPVKGVPRKAEFIQQNRTQHSWVIKQIKPILDGVPKKSKVA